jgi:hypothetical protein
VSPAGPVPAPQAVTGSTGAAGPRAPGEGRVGVPPRAGEARGSPAGGTGGAGGAATSASPGEIPPPPRPGASADSVAQHLAWLDSAGRVLDRRIDHYGAELEQLRVQWAHAVRNLGRLRPEEVTSIVEGQARLREVVAADRALRDLVEIQRRQVAGWAEVVGRPATDEALVGRLLDDVAAERARTAETMLEVAVEAIAGVVLDLEVVRREGRHDPARVALGLVGLRQRLAGVADGLRERAQAAGVRLVPGEPLPAALRRLADAHRPAVRAGVAWSGPEAVGARAGAAVPAVVLECLQHLAGAPGTVAEVAVHVDGGGAVVVRILTEGEGLLAAEDDPWLVRSRARAALAGGRLLCGRAGGGSLVDLRLP